MNCYAIQVRTRSEEKYIRLFKSQHSDESFQIHFPRRRINNKRDGKIIPAMYAVFPGYIFIEAASDDILRHQWDFRRIEGFFRFLKSNSNITPIIENDLNIVHHFIKPAGAVVDISKVYFNDKSRIVVLEGPLSGLEGNIIKVDKKRCRAKIKLDLFDDSFTIDLAFEVLGKPEKSPL